jgi:carbon storage regulator
MLVISRRIGESFLIGDDMEATIIDITGDRVVLGITAPRSMEITRCDTMPERPAGAKGYGRRYKTSPPPPGKKHNVESDK